MEKFTNRNGKITVEKERERESEESEEREEREEKQEILPIKKGNIKQKAGEVW